MLSVGEAIAFIFGWFYNLLRSAVGAVSSELLPTFLFAVAGGLFCHLRFCSSQGLSLS